LEDFIFGGLACEAEGKESTREAKIQHIESHHPSVWIGRAKARTEKSNPLLLFFSQVEV
jgi:hypothetical protein